MVRLSEGTLVVCSCPSSSQRRTSSLGRAARRARLGGRLPLLPRSRRCVPPRESWWSRCTSVLLAATCVVHSISLSQTVSLCAGHQGADLLPREDRRRRARNLGSHRCVLSRPTQVACRCPVFLKVGGWRGLIPSSIDSSRYPQHGCCPVSCATKPSNLGCGWLTAGASRTGKETKNPIPREQTMKALQVCPGPVSRQA
jgi:hypothetical protein